MIFALRNFWTASNYFCNTVTYSYKTDILIYHTTETDINRQFTKIFEIFKASRSKWETKVATFKLQHLLVSGVSSFLHAFVRGYSQSTHTNEGGGGQTKAYIFQKFCIHCFVRWTRENFKIHHFPSANFVRGP